MVYKLVLEFFVKGDVLYHGALIKSSMGVYYLVQSIGC